MRLVLATACAGANVEIPGQMGGLEADRLNLLLCHIRSAAGYDDSRLVRPYEPELRRAVVIPYRCVQVL